MKDHVSELGSDVTPKIHKSKLTRIDSNRTCSDQQYIKKGSFRTVDEQDEIQSDEPISDRFANSIHRFSDL